MIYIVLLGTSTCSMYEFPCRGTLIVGIVTILIIPIIIFLTSKLSFRQLSAVTENKLEHLNKR
jgi:hypothetical protein